MRILMINPGWNAYSEVWLQRMMQYFKDDIVGLACFNPGEDKWLNGAPVFDLYGKKPAFWRRILYRIFKKDFFPGNIESEFSGFVHRAAPDLIFINFIGPALYLKKVLQKIKLPVFVHIHGIDIFPDAKNEMTGERFHPSGYAEDIKNLAASVPNLRFISNSAFSGRELEKIGIPGKQIFLKYFGMPAGKAKTMQNAILSVLYLGRFVDFKGPELVVKSFLKACDAGFSGTLTMVGDGDLKPFCKRLAENSAYASRIFFKDPVNAEGALTYFRSADIFTMHNCLGPSSNRAEAFGVTLIEAMSQGTPVVTAAYGGPAEIVKTGYNGILAEPGNIDQHAEALLFFEKNPAKWQEMSRNCIDTISSVFSSEKEKERLLEIFQEGLEAASNKLN